MTAPKLFPEPPGVNATAVECPTCGTWVGFACGDAHCDGYHRKRIEAAKQIAKLQWKKTGPSDCRSICGRYHIWVQGRPRDDGLQYAAERVGQRPWLCSLAGSIREAKDVCREHLANAKS